MDVVGAALGCVLDDDGGALDPVIGGAALGGRAAPGKVGVGQVGFDFRDPGRRGVILDDIDPFPDDFHKLGLLLVGEVGTPDALGIDLLVILAGAEHEIARLRGAVLGMDIGTLAAYAKPGQLFHFTERVPIFVKLSLPDKGEKRHFTFVQDAIERGAKVKVFEGEPREMIEKHGVDKFYKVIVVESYKMPVIEVHKELMTKEALTMLMGKVRDDGIVEFHMSNRYYDLAPIIASAAHDLKLACIVGNERGYYGEPDMEKNDFRFSSEWVMVARDTKHLAHLKKDEANRIDWHPPTFTKMVQGKAVETKIIDKEFLWTDKAEQSFRGLYRSDPSFLRFAKSKKKDISARR